MITSIKGKFKNLDWRLGIYLLAIPILLLYVLVLTGCISDSPGMPNLFLVEIMDPEDPDIEVRFGYFGLCIRVQSYFSCLPTNGMTADSFTVPTQDTAQIEALISKTLSIQKKIIPYVLVAAGLFFLVGLIALAFLKRNNKAGKHALRRDTFRKATLGLVWGSVGLVYGAAILVGQVNAVLEWATASFANTAVHLTGSTPVLVLHWLTFALSFIFAIGVSIILSQRTDMGKSEVPSIGGLPRSVSPPPPPPPPLATGSIGRPPAPFV